MGTIKLTPPGFTITDYEFVSSDGDARLRLWGKSEWISISFSGVLGWSFVPDLMLSGKLDVSFWSLVERPIASANCELEGFFNFDLYVPELGIFEIIAASSSLH